MALPNSINAATPAGSASPATIDDQFRALKTFLEDIFSIPDNTNIAAAGLDFVAAGLQTVIFQDAAGAPATAGHLQRNGADLQFYDGTAARTAVWLDKAQTLTSKTLTAPAINGTVTTTGLTMPAFAAGGTISGATGITSVGTIATGVWQGTAVAAGFGGTGLTGTPANGQLPIGNGSGYVLATLTAGGGISIVNGVGTITISGAPTDAQYLALAASGSLSDERVFTPGKGLSGTDGGAGSTYTLRTKDIGARVTHNTTQAVNNDTATALTFNTERWDTDTIHDTVTNAERLTCKTAGKYVITANIEWALATSAGLRRLDLRLNGATVIARELSPSADNMIQSIATIYSLAVNDYVEVVAYQNSGSGSNIAASGNLSPEFAMQMIAEV